MSKVLPPMILYVGEGCPYCERVLNFLKQHPLPVKIKEVWDHPEAFEELKKIAGKTQVPCLKIGDEVMHESLDIIERLRSLV